MQSHTKKLVAPIIITVLIIIYFVFYIYMGLYINDMPSIIKILFIIIPICFIILSIYMLIERIREIKGGEEDDLSKY